MQLLLPREPRAYPRETEAYNRLCGTYLMVSGVGFSNDSRGYPRSTDPIPWNGSLSWGVWSMLQAVWSIQ